MARAGAAQTPPGGVTPEFAAGSPAVTPGRLRQAPPQQFLRKTQPAPDQGRACQIRMSGRAVLY